MSEPSPGDDLPLRVGVREFRGNLTAYLRMARRGRTLLVTSHDQVVAEIRPPADAGRTARRPGALKGELRLSPDFDSLPDDMLEAMESGV